MSKSEIAIPAQKPAARVALLMATGLGLGYLPIASGTWGSLGSIGLYVLLEWTWALGGPPPITPTFVAFHLLLNVLVALGGLWAAGRAARYFQTSDPGYVVIDEISGQQIALIGLAPVGWKYLLAAFLLFRLFDIWKPFPARQAEAWPGGWGIMADDWFAGVYTAMVLWSARLLGW